MAAPALVVRVAANLSELKQNLKEGESAIEKIGETSSRTREKTQTLSTAYKQFDDVLRVAGVNIGPQVKAIDDLRAAAAKAGDGLGLVAKAGLAVGAGMAAWGITRAAMEFLQLDGAVEKAWRSLLNYGNAVGEAAGAKQDVINRAIAQGAAATISYTEAIEFNTQAFRRDSDAKIDWTAKLAAAHKEVRGLSESKIQQIEIAQKAGATTEQLTNKFGLSATALKLLAEQQKQAGQAAEEHAKKLQALDAAYSKLMSDAKNANQLAIMEEEARFRAQVAEQEAFFAEQEIQVRLRKQEASRAELAAEQAAEAQRVAANQAEIDGLLATGEAHFKSGVIAKEASDKTIAGYQGVAQQITITGEAVKEWINLMRYTAEANAILQGGSSLFTTQSQRERIAALPARANGGPVSSGQPYVVGERGPEVFVPERSGSIIPNGAGGGNTFNISVNVDGSVLSTAAQLRDAVSGALVDVFRSGALPMPANV